MPHMHVRLLRVAVLCAYICALSTFKMADFLPVKKKHVHKTERDLGLGKGFPFQCLCNYIGRVVILGMLLVA